MVPGGTPICGGPASATGALWPTWRVSSSYRMRGTSMGTGCVKVVYSFGRMKLPNSKPNVSSPVFLARDEVGFKPARDGESEFLAQRLDQFDLAARASRFCPDLVAMNIAEVALNPGVAPGTHLRVDADLVHGARVGFDERSQAQRRLGEGAGILEAFRSDRNRSGRG